MQPASTPAWPSVRIQAAVRTPDINVELRSYCWPEPGEIVARRSTPAINLSLGQISPLTKLAYQHNHGWGEYTEMGSLIFIPPGEPLQVRSTAGEHFSLQCEINEAKWLAFSDLPAGRLDERQLAASLDVRDDFIYEGMMRLAGEVASPGFGSAVLTESLGITLLGQLTRYLRRVVSRAGEAGGISQPQLRRIDEFIEESDGARITVAALAEICGMSRAHFMRVFKKNTGRTVYSYIKGKQITRAKSLLSCTTLPLKEISFRLGFSSQTSFSLAFRSATGETPHHFRRNHRVR